MFAKFLVFCWFSLASSLVITNPCCSQYSHMQATFPDNDSVYSQSISGSVGVSVPLDGCVSPITIGVNNTIALIQRSQPGGCTFVQKALNAQLGGAIGVIIFNREGDDSNDLVPMGSDSSDADFVTIPTIFITLHDGEQIQNLTKYYPMVMATINSTGAQTYENSANVLTQAFWHTIIVFFEVFLILWIIFAIIICISWGKEKYASKARNRKVKELPMRIYAASSNHTSFDSNSCVICLEDFKDGEKLRTLPCKHEFHQKCIDPWLIEKSPLCPMCKRTILPQEVLSSSLVTVTQGEYEETINVVPSPERGLLHERFGATPRLNHFIRQMRPFCFNFSGRILPASNCVTIITIASIIFVTVTFLVVLQQLTASMNKNP